MQTLSSFACVRRSGPSAARTREAGRPSAARLLNDAESRTRSGPDTDPGSARTPFRGWSSARWPRRSARRAPGPVSGPPVSSYCWRPHPFLDPVDFGSARDGHDPRLLGKEPGECDLQGVAVLRPAIQVGCVDHRRPGCSVSGLKRGMVLRLSLSESKFGGCIDGAGEELITQRGCRDSKPMPSSFQKASTSSSGQCHHGEYSLCTAVIV